MDERGGAPARSFGAYGSGGRPSRQRLAARAARIALAALIATSCGGRGGGAPVPTLAEKPEAGIAWRAIATRWEQASPGGRSRLAAELRAFRARYPEEAVSALAEVWLAWIALERGDLEEAARLAHPSASGPPGTRRDLARAIEGAVLRRAGRAAPPRPSRASRRSPAR